MTDTNIILHISELQQGRGWITWRTWQEGWWLTN